MKNISVKGKTVKQVFEEVLHKSVLANTPLEPTQPKESWEEQIVPLLNALYYEAIRDCDNDKEEFPIRKKLIQPIKQFIKNLLEEEYERGRHDNIIDISTWKNLGEKRGYFKFFKENLNVRHEVDPKTGEIKRVII